MTTSPKINRIIPPTCEIYCPEGKYVGTVNEYELMDFLVQIKEGQHTGYTLLFNTLVIRIDRYGSLEDYPKGLLDIMSDYQLKLLL